MFQASLDQEMFTYWNENGYTDFMAQLREVEQLPREKQTIKITLPGRKKSRNKTPYYTFIAADSIDALKAWFPHRPENAPAIITNQFGKPISKTAMRHYWIKRLRDQGILPLFKKGERVNNTGKGLHEMRDVFRTLWSKSPANYIVGEFMMGHKVDPLNYDKSHRDVEFYKNEYRKVIPFLNLWSSGAAFGRVDKKELDILQEELQQAQKGQDKRVKDLEKRNYELDKKLEEIYKLLKQSNE
jgi:hypothetical protein